MRITYIGFGDFHRYAGMKQLYHFAQEVCRQGHQAQILIAGKADTVQSMEESPLAEIVELQFVGPFLTRSVRQRVKDFKPDILHVWTPRQVPALAGLQLQHVTDAKLILDHEDDEDYHARYQQQAWRRNWQQGLRRWLLPLNLARNELHSWAKPLQANGGAFRGAYDGLTYPRIMKRAQAHTAISPNLVAWAKERSPDTPVYLLYPGANLELFSPQIDGGRIRTKLGLKERRVLVYTGTMSLEIFTWFMDVLAQVVSIDPDVVLVLVGEDRFRIAAERLAEERGLSGNYYLIGQSPYADIPNYLAAADILLQHALDQANALRLPAKLPEYLAMGKPIITFAEGIGESLDDGIHVCKLYSREPSEAASHVITILGNPMLQRKLGEGARELACKRFDWHKNGAELVQIYHRVLSQR